MQKESAVISESDIDNLKRVEVSEKKVGACNLCCSWCCLITGFSGFLLLALFSLALYERWYFEAAWQLPEVDKETYETKSLMFLVGAAFECVVGILSIFWVRANIRKSKK